MLASTTTEEIERKWSSLLCEDPWSSRPSKHRRGCDECSLLLFGPQTRCFARAFANTLYQDHEHFILKTWRETWLLFRPSLMREDQDQFWNVKMIGTYWIESITFWRALTCWAVTQGIHSSPSTSRSFSRVTFVKLISISLISLLSVFFVDIDILTQAIGKFVDCKLFHISWSFFPEESSDSDAFLSELASFNGIGVFDLSFIKNWLTSRSNFVNTVMIGIFTVQLISTQSSDEGELLTLYSQLQQALITWFQ